MPKEIFEVVRERFHLSDRTQYIVQGHWPKDAVMEAYLDQHKLKVSVKENENVSALERIKNMSGFPSLPVNWIKKEINRRYILKKRVQNRELYGSEGGPLHPSL